MKKRVFLSIFLTAATMIFICSVLLITTLYGEFAQERKNILYEELTIIERSIDLNGIQILEDLSEDTESRLTLIDISGRVIFDSKLDFSKMENHCDRPEIIDAFTYGEGQSTRMSNSMDYTSYYYAIKIDDNTVLRISNETLSFKSMLDRSLLVVLGISIACIFGSMYIANRFTKSIITPILTLNLDNPLDNVEYEEISPLLLRMDKQNKKINSQVLSLKQKQREFDGIIENMHESLIIFSNDKHILSANRSACKTFGVKHAQNLSYIELCRDPIYLQSVENAFIGKISNSKYEKNGRIYNLSVAPVECAEGFGAVLLAVDVTEKELADSMRQEFSANVSHELKTPLTSILGYAELMKSGFAKPADFPKFSTHIYDEANRLLSLIQDIIKLSHLDETGLREQFTEVDLYSVCRDVVNQLTMKAQGLNIKLDLFGENVTISALNAPLHEMIFNLCDNALNYNVPNGSVDIRIVTKPDKVKLIVSDTGIGIKEEHQPRIFERFYRVDKSHSKITGGTGLGLSIVKHTAMLHNANLSLESTFGAGTKITVEFPI